MSESTPTPPPLGAPASPPLGGKPPFARTAAQFCAWSPVIAIVMNVMFSGMAKQGGPGSQIFAYIGSLIMLLGIVLGIVALCSIPKYGRKGILIPSTIGLTINIALMALAFFAVQKLKARAEAIRAQTEQQQQAR